MSAANPNINDLPSDRVVANLSIRASSSTHCWASQAHPNLPDRIREKLKLAPAARSRSGWCVFDVAVRARSGIIVAARTLTQEQMLYCLFKHTASQAVRDLAVRVGERVIIKRATLRVLRTVAQRIGVKVTHRVIARTVSRWLPVVGALGVAAYAYYDTAHVAKIAIELFEGELK